MVVRKDGMKTKRSQIVVLVLVLAIAVFAGLNSQRYFFRLDLTRNRAYSISRVSKNLFQEIPEQLFITYYVSDKLKSLYPFPAQIEDLLLQYAAFSRGRIKVNVLDPAAAGETAQVESLGIFPQQIEVVEQDELSYATVYTGIIIQYLDRYETLPVVFRLDSLEYDLSSRIRALVQNEKQVIGLLSGDDGRAVTEDFRTAMSILSRDFAVREVARGETIPEDVSVLFVFGNKDLDSFDCFPIDQYIMSGGRALFAVEGVQVDLLRNLEAGRLESSPLLDMLEAYGVRVQREQLLDAYCQNFRLPRQLFGQIMWEVLGKYPHWITVSEQFVSRDNAITARFAGLDLYWASPLELLPRQDVTAETLVRTTPEAWTMADRFETDPQRSESLLYTEHENKGQRVVAAALYGGLPSWFAGRDIPSRAGEERDWETIVPRADETRILVVGDSDFASEIYQYTDAAYNLDFLSNAASWLSNEEDLLEIKTRTTRDMRLNKIQDREARISLAWFTQMFATVLVPLMVIAFGLIRFAVRRKRSIMNKLED
jgi:ABC-2 type transport system permease protein